MTLPAAHAPAPGIEIQEIRFYQVGQGPRTWYAVTCGRLVAAATRSYARACQYYAWERGVPRSQIGGPTHQVADARELALSVHHQGQEGGP